MLEKNVNKLLFCAPSKILFQLHDGQNKESIFLNTKLTRVTVFKSLNEFNKNKLIEIKKEGRDKLIYLTEKGKKLQLLFNELNNNL